VILRVKLCVPCWQPWQAEATLWSSASRADAPHAHAFAKSYSRRLPVVWRGKGERRMPEVMHGRSSNAASIE